MHIEWFYILQLIDEKFGLLLNLLFILLEVFILAELLRIDHCFNELTILLESLEDIQVDIALVVDVPEVFIHLLALPFFQEDLIVHNCHRGHSVECLLDRSPVVLW